MPARAQNNAQNNLEIVTTVKQAEQAERERIKRERSAATQEMAAQRQACYQKLAVTPCMNEARDMHNEKTRDLKRQEVALNDVQRKRAAADRVKAADQRHSPETQLQRAQDRGKALEATARREESQAKRKKSRETKLAEAAAQAKAKPPSTSPSKEDGAVVPQPQGNPRSQQAKKIASAQRTGQAERSANSAQQAVRRERDAQLRHEKAAEREAKRKKPAAAGLPVPAEAK